MHFEHLRTIPWYPTFVWVKTSMEAIDKINLPHEDYPKYVYFTSIALWDIMEEWDIVGKINVGYQGIVLRCSKCIVNVPTLQDIKVICYKA